MDLEDLLKKRKPYKHKQAHGHRYGGHEEGLLPFLGVAERLLKSKTLWIVALVLVLLVGAAGVALVLAVIPLFTGSLEFIEQNGIKGAVDAVKPYADKIWYGNAANP